MQQRRGERSRRFFSADSCGKPPPRPHQFEVGGDFCVRRQKTMAATTTTPTVNQFTPIHVLRSKWTRKIGLYSPANTPKTQAQSTRFFSCAAKAEYANTGQQIHLKSV